MSDYLSVAPDVKLGENVKLSRFINLYGCEIGDYTMVGAFVENQKNVRSKITGCSHPSYASRAA